MGRFYEVTLSPAPGSTGTGRTWTSYNGTITNPNNFIPQALNVEFDMPILPAATPGGGQTITIHGIALEDLNQSQQFAGMNITVKAGMGAGFPLVNPAQAGTIIVGSVLQSFGNWEGTEQSLDLVIYPSIYTIDNPGNLTLNWTAGMPLSTALQQTLSTAYPHYPISMNISPALVNDSDQPDAATTLEELAQFVSDFTKKQFQNEVVIMIQGGRITVNDSTYKPGPIQMVFTDFIGQPTWIEPLIMQVKTVMRADLQVGSIIQMPQGIQNAPGFINTTGNAQPSTVKYQSAFKNSFTIVELRQIGNFRASDAGDWCTVFNCVANP